MGSMFPSLEEWEESTLSAAATLKNGPEKSTKTSSDHAPINNPHADSKSMRGSIVSRITSPGSLLFPKRERPPAPPLKLPAFQKKSIINASNPLFDKFKQERMHTAIMHEDPFLDEESEDGSESIQGSDDTVLMDPEPRVDPTRLTVSAYSRRTSFSFDYANSDGFHPEDLAFSVQALNTRKPIKSTKMYANGIYQPAGTPASSNYF